MSRGRVAVGPDWVAVGRRRHGSDEWFDRRAVGSFEEAINVMDLLLAHLRLRRTQGIEVVLHSPWVQVRTLSDLPPVSESDLRILIAGDSTRYFRGEPGGLITDAAAVSTSDGRALVRAVAVHTEVVESLGRAVERSGRRLVGVLAEFSDVRRALRLDSSAIRARRRRSHLVQVSVALALACAGWGSALTLYCADLVADRRAIRAELAALAPVLDRIENVRARLAEVHPVTRAIAGQGAAGEWSLPLLEAIATALPSPGFVSQMRATDEGFVRVAGVAPDPAAFVKALEEHGLGSISLDEPPAPREDGLYTFSLSIRGAD